MAEAEKVLKIILAGADHIFTKEDFEDPFSMNENKIITV